MDTGIQWEMLVSKRTNQVKLELHSAEEVAGLLGIEVDTLYRYARKGRIRGMKIGKSWRFSETDVQDFVEQQRYPASPAEPRVSLLPDILKSAAAQTAGQGGVLCRGVEASYADVNAMSDRLASCLFACGVRPGDRVLLLLSNSLEFITSCFAVWKVGAVLIPEDPAIKDENLRHILNDSSPVALIVERSVAERLNSLGDDLKSVATVFVKDRSYELSGLDHIRVESLDAVLETEAEKKFQAPAGASPADIVSITYTSGTTGRPKGVMNTHESWLAGAVFTRDFHGLTKRDSIVIPLPPHHGLAFRQMLAYVLAGARILLASDIYQALKLMRERRPSAAVLVPAGVNILIDHFAPVLQELSSSLRYVEIGSAPLGPERFEDLRQLLPSTFIHLPYGLTEARVGFLRAGADGLLNRIAKVAPSLELQLVDENGQPALPGQVGEIRLKGPGLMKGYWGQAEPDLALLKRDGFRTGDMGVMDDTGSVALLGRKDEMLKVGGHKVNPAEVEAVLRRHPAVQECAVVGAADPEGVFETKLHAFVVPTAKHATISARELEAHCRNYLESYKVPARFHFQNSLPKSAIGKVLRQALKTVAANSLAAKALAEPAPGT